MDNYIIGMVFYRYSKSSFPTKLNDYFLANNFLIIKLRGESRFKINELIQIKHIHATLWCQKIRKEKKRKS